MSFAIIRILHLLAALVLGMAILVTNMGFSRELSRDDRQSLKKMLLLQGIAAAVTALAGTVLWLAVGRPAAFYQGNPLFLAKLLLFLLLVLLPVPAALHLGRHANRTASKTPRHVLIALRLQLFILICIPALAWLIARGIGH